MPDTTQWNPVTEFHQNWPDSGLSDAQILFNLQDPQKFRSAFPHYTGVTDDEIRSKMKAYLKPQAQAPDQSALMQQTAAAAVAGGAPQTSVPGSASRSLPTVQPISRYMPQYQTFNPRTTPVYATPIAPYGAVASIPRAIGALAGGYGGTKAGEYVAEKTNLTKSESVWARDIGALLGSMVGGGTAAGAESLWGNIKSALGRKIYTPSGDLTPAADAIVHPTKLPETALRTVIPQPGTGAPLPSSAEFYENRAADLAKRTGDVSTEGQQSGGAAATEPSAAEYYKNKAADLVRRGKEQATLDRAAARAATPKGTITITPSQGMSTSPESVSQMPPVQPSTAPESTAPVTSTGPQAKIVTNEPPPVTRSRIVAPGSPPPTIKGSFWSYPENELRKAVLSGDREAAVIYRMRFNTLPEGAKYLTDVTDSVIKGLYRSRK